MESQYSVSVIIPVHNTAPYLRRCIESVRNQTLKDIEIILVDNLSTDDSPSICNEYANIDSRVKVLHLDEAGLSIARNAGIEIATAPYIGFIDSDDYIEPTMYENMLSAMVQNKVYMVYCNFCFEYEDGCIEQKYPDKNILVVCHGGIVRVIHSYFHDMTNDDLMTWLPENCCIQCYEK